MKTTTYLRLALLIPFLVWGLCVLFFAIWSSFESSGLESMGSNVITGLFLWTILFYTFGIIGWFLPYLLLSAILLVWSFRSRAQVLMKVFALSPLAMAILIVSFMSLLSLGADDWNTFSPNPMANFESFFGSSVWFALLALIWGYICVGVGLGVYKLLQWLGFIKDEVRAEPMDLIQEPLEAQNLAG